ncbi:hypothetical protein [Micromonospora sp. L5]|uniref:hypothetical protein n=1 Tax=Micromonospora sp. (strain L5) TaxID=648999 RepID=UPI00117FA08C|nr:hypothetical protein [Micromonospora sp. L5]
MNDDEFIERECQGVDFDPVILAHCEALDLEEQLHPGEEPIARAERLIRETVPAAYMTIFDLAIAAENPLVRHDAREFLMDLHAGRGNPIDEEK